MLKGASERRSAGQALRSPVPLYNTPHITHRLRHTNPDPAGLEAGGWGLRAGLG